MGLIQFVRNYSDLSTDNGFQFEFFCDRCGSGYQSGFVNANTGAFDLLDAAGSLFGGIVGSVASLGERARSSAWEKAHDDAFRGAVQAARPHFHQCRRCGQWNDAICWNAPRNLCKDCAPDEDTEYESSQARIAIEKTEEQLREGKAGKPAARKAKTAKPKAAPTAQCVGCGASVGGAKFCPECGTPVAKKAFCKDCGAEATGKFCAECGAPQ